MTIFVNSTPCTVAFILQNTVQMIYSVFQDDDDDDDDDIHSINQLHGFLYNL